jgi:tetratricopeptide (TPR) repeat protein
MCGGITAPPPHFLSPMQRRWRVPPPPQRGFGAADGAAVLSENVAGFGVLLWDVARDVVLWATSAPAELEEVFAPALERMRMASLVVQPVAPVLESALSVLARAPRSPQPVSRERVSLACSQISHWADGNGAVATASAFAHAAAVTCPGSARLSYEAGRFARRQADYTRAEMWLARAVLLGRQLEDWSSCINARGGLGNLYIQRGNYRRAERHHRRALQLARRTGSRDLEGTALHGLFLINSESGREAEMNACARAAHQAYGEGHPKLPVLAHDVACAWMEQGYFTRSLDVFEALHPHFSRDQRVAVLANICRAAAGTGDVGRFSTAWADTHTLIEAGHGEEYVAEAMLDLALGAALLMQWERAECSANRSLEIATVRREARIQITAEAVLQQIRNEQLVHARVVANTRAVAEEVDVFADELVESLTACAVVGA